MSYDDRISYCGPKKCIVPRSWITIEENLVCFLHDLMYQTIGNKSYTRFSGADQILIDHLKNIPKKSFIGWVVIIVFLIKKKICPHIE